MPPVSRVNEWLALLRVDEGGVTSWEGQFLNHGQPVADYLAAAFGELIRTNNSRWADLTQWAAASLPHPGGADQVPGADRQRAGGNSDQLRRGPRGAAGA